MAFAHLFLSSSLVPRAVVVRELAGSYRDTIDIGEIRRRWPLEDLRRSFRWFRYVYLRVYAYVYYVYSYVYIYVYMYVYLCIGIYNQRYIAVSH